MNADSSGAPSLRPCQWPAEEDALPKARTVSVQRSPPHDRADTAAALKICTAACAKQGPAVNLSGTGTVSNPAVGSGQRNNRLRGTRPSEIACSKSITSANVAAERSWVTWYSRRSSISHMAGIRLVGRFDGPWPPVMQAVAWLRQVRLLRACSLTWAKR